MVGPGAAVILGRQIFAEIGLAGISQLQLVFLEHLKMIVHDLDIFDDWRLEFS